MDKDLIPWLLLASMAGAVAGWWVAQTFRVGTGRFWTSRARRNGSRPTTRWLERQSGTWHEKSSAFRPRRVR
jgi:hypothetical protein